MSDVGVNGTITDAVTQAQASTVGIAAAQSLAMLDMVLADALGRGMHNAYQTQHNDHIMNSAAVAAVCRRILGSVGPGLAPPTPPPPPAPPSPPASAADVARQTQAAAKAVTALQAANATASQSAKAAAASLEEIARRAAEVDPAPPVVDPTAPATPSSPPPSSAGS